MPVWCTFIFLQQHGTPPTEATEKQNNQPHIVIFDDDDSTLNQYFVSVEQKLVLESASVQSALYLCLVSHYIYNLEYHKRVTDFWLFIQEKILNLPASKVHTRRSPSAVSHISGICRLFQTLSKWHCSSIVCFLFRLFHWCELSEHTHTWTSGHALLL